MMFRLPLGNVQGQGQCQNVLKKSLVRFGLRTSLWKCDIEMKHGLLAAFLQEILVVVSKIRETIDNQTTEKSCNYTYWCIGFCAFGVFRVSVYKVKVTVT